ncbi:beta-ketoacyl synthase N-terminal-like domain-containing protein [Actinosynnema sp. NPDC023587]|uniref:type I polyketide synthase n=1 Tax=Actinosynnema sp. NPDC023587 TaxID=3154695 RepID=UPI0033D8DECF
MTEPIAVVGVGCRFPGGVGTPEAFWDLVVAGRDTSGPAPTERWDWYRDLSPAHEAALRHVTSRGSFLDDVAGFDAAFFGLSGREAELMDPQQRILLETAWEALEHAGVPPHSLAGTETGVYIGFCTADYGRRLLEDLPGIEAWTGIGAATCALADRIAHALDLRGPSLAVDTACSASLVSLHLACQGLRAGDCSTALAGGVNLILSPGETLSLDAAGALSPDGRSKPFDADADGYGRGEGCGVLVLRRLSDARRAGDRVLAVVRGSAVSQDGRTEGIMAPSGPAQEHVMRRACANAGIDPTTVGFVEAHGTGTRLGDPAEVAALSAVYGRDEPCPIGSVKGNIGHLEGAAGVASVVKAVLALERGVVPPGVLRRLNPDIPWEDNGLRVATEAEPWTGHPRRAAVSGFGYGGAIAHVVLEQAPEDAPGVGPGAGTWVGSGVRESGGSRFAERGGLRVYPVSAASAEALAAGAGRLERRLADGVPLTSVGHTLALRRSHLAHRAVVPATGPDDLRARLRVLANGQAVDGVTVGRPVNGPGPVFVFSGHGSQWPGMGRELLEAEPAFGAALDEVEPVYRREMGFSPRKALRDGDLGDVARTQALIFTVQLGLTSVWRSYGVTPAAVIGHSVGEIAAAVACGGLDPLDGARLVCRRSLLLRRVAGRGAMALVGLDSDEVTRRLAGRGDVVVAIIPSPSTTVVSGEPAAVADFLTRCGDALVREIASDVAFHSPQMEPLLADLKAVDVLPREPAIPVYRTAVADPRSRVALDADYWVRNLREPVRLAAAVSAAAADGYRAFLEISAHPVVAHSVVECLADLDDDTAVGWTLRRDRPEQREFLSSLGQAHCHGVRVDWARLHPSGHLVTLPTVAWQHRDHWRTPEPVTGTRGHDVTAHTLLGARTAVAGSAVTAWRTSLDDTNRPYPGSHTVSGTELVPAAVLAQTFLDAGGGGVLVDLVMRRPLLTAQRREVQVVREGGRLRLASRIEAGQGEAGQGEGGTEGEWTVHAEAEASSTRPVPPIPGSTALDSVDTDFVRRRLTAVGVPSTGFDWTIERLAVGRGRLRADVVTAPGSTWAPVVDAVMTLAPAAFEGEPELRMAVRVDRLEVVGGPPSAFTVEVTPAGPDTVDVVVSAGGVVAAYATGLRYPVIGRAGRSVHRFVWKPLDLPVACDGPEMQGGRGVEGGLRVVVVGPLQALRNAMGDGLTAAGIPWHAVDRLIELDPLDAVTDVVVIGDVELADPALLTDAAAAAVVGGEAVARVWCVTAGVRECADEGRLAQTSLWGVARALHVDQPVTVVDVDPGTSWVPLAVSLLGEDLPDAVVVLRAGSAAVPRLESAIHRTPVSCRAESTYLVTGGLGEVGLAATRELVSRGARRIVLVGNDVLPPRRVWDEVEDAALRRRVDVIRWCEEQGVTVRVVESAQVFDDLPPVLGIVHGEERDASCLHSLYPPGSLDFLVLCVPGNAFFLPADVEAAVTGAGHEGLAEFRGGDTTVLTWLGVTPEEALAAWDGPGFTVVVQDADDLPEPLRSPVAESGPGDARDAEVVPEQLREHVLHEVGAQIAAEMRLAESGLDHRRPLVDQGLDSVMGVMVRKRLEKRFGYDLPAVLLWQRPTVTAIADHLVELLRAGAARSRSTFDQDSGWDR